MFDSFNISGSGLTANKLWLDTVAANIANMNSTGRPGDPEQPPYKRRVPVFARALEERLGATAAQKPAGVTVTRIAEDKSKPRLVYNPSHPHAGENGYVAMPNINITNEMANMMAATRAYQANATALESAKEIAQTALRIMRG